MQRPFHPLRAPAALAGWRTATLIEMRSPRRVCAVAHTRTGSRVTDTRRWCERVNVVPGRGHGKGTVAKDVCFRVKNIGDPIPATVRGTLFRSN